MFDTTPRPFHALRARSRSWRAVRHVLGAALMSTALLAFAGCPDEPKGTVVDAGNTGGTGGTGGVVTAGCTRDVECAAGEICDLGTGECGPGQDCTQNPGLCQFCEDPQSQCGFKAPAFCDDQAGVCRRTGGTCTPCLADAECGVGAAGDNKCINNHCAEACGQCPAGFQCQDGGCVPAEQAGTCENAIFCQGASDCPDGQQCSDLGVCLSLCASDADCPAGKICWQEAGPLQSLCLNGCAPGDTRNDEVCHQDGRFGPPCTAPDVEGPAGGCPEGTVCTASGVCELAGCASDADCDVVRTYCDTASGECIPGCNSDDDCGAFEECETDTATCKKQGCRGKDVSCGLGEWCCGQDRYQTEACPAEVEQGACFVTPEPWCRTCNDNDDCADIDAFGYASLCFEMQRENPDTGETETIGKFCSVGCETNADCPRGIQCIQDLPAGQNGETTKGCLAAICAPIAEGRAGQ